MGSSPRPSAGRTDGERYALRVLKAGAAGYLTKESAPDELMTALRKVAAGGKYVSPTLAERLADEIGTEIDELPHERLSDREHQILCMIASCMTVTGIASELHLGTNTVSTYRARLLGNSDWPTTPNSRTTPSATGWWTDTLPVPVFFAPSRLCVKTF